MKRRSGATGAASKARGRKTQTPKRRVARKAMRPQRSSVASREPDVAQVIRERDEALEQQTASAEVLQIISGSTFDLQTVLDTLVKSAARLCEADAAAIWRPDGGKLKMAANFGASSEWKEFAKQNPITPDRGTISGRVILEGKVVHVRDVLADPEITGVGYFVRGNYRTSLGVPLSRKGETIGVFVIVRSEVREFTEKQIKLVTTFAAQAVIAIENARLLNELRQRTDDLSQRTADLTEALEQQTATSEVLQVISSSPGELKPVFQTILENATRICGANFGMFHLREGEALTNAAVYNIPEPYMEFRRRTPLTISPNHPLARLAATKEVVHIADLKADDGYREGDPSYHAMVDLAGARTLLLVPTLKEREIIGVITIFRQEARLFTDKQVDLVKNFAAQAVIAIENAWLLNELRQRTTDLTEALEQQTATSEVLEVISSSPGALEPVFAKMLENAARICDAQFGNIFQWDGVALRLVGTHNTPPAFAELLRRSPLRPTHSNSSLGRMLASKAADQNADVAAGQLYAERDPMAAAAVEVGGVRTVLNVPMLKDNELLGAFSIYRQEVRPFTDKQVDLVKNFAAQAVIAIENARLLNELRQSFEQQTATSEVLRVISSTAGELEPVFATILASATRICEAEFGNLLFREEEAFRIVAWHGEPTYVNAWRHEALIVRTDVTDIPLSRVAATKKRVHIADLRQEAAYKAGFAPLVALVDKGGARTILIVPMLQEHALIGAIAIYRQDVRPFTDKQIALMENFAAQAVIAIENARLLKELRERTDEVEKLNQQLERHVADQVGEIERMGRLRRFLPQQVADLIVASGTEKQLESHRREITALFCDLRGFTGFSESSDPEDVMALLRDYHAAIGEIIIKCSGTLERYAGDGVMVVFNDPVPVEKPALQAVLMALEMREVIGALTEKWRRLGHEIGFGIGIAHGFATLGTIGFEGRFDYAAIGTVANVASRLCDEAKPGQILVSPRVFMAVEDAVTVEPVGEFTLKGIRRPLAAYNVLAANAAN